MGLTTAMKKALVFVAAFAMVLTAGAALAFMTSPGGEDGAEAEKPVATVEEPRTVKVDSESTPEKSTEDPSEKPEKKQSSESQPAKSESATEKETDTPDSDEKASPVEEADTVAPDLVIAHPENGQHFTEPKIAFEGKTEPGARVFAGKYEADVDSEGNWRIVLILSKGGNVATLKAVDEAGNESFAKVEAFYDVPVEEPTKDKSEEKPRDDKPKDETVDYEFKAHQKYGSCAEPVPYDVWYGKGTPGTKVYVVSAFGSNSTTIGEKGTWDLKVEFPGAPCGEAFEVVLETDDGHRKEFQFTRLCEEPKDGEEGHDK